MFTTKSENKFIKEAVMATIKKNKRKKEASMFKNWFKGRKVELSKPIQFSEENEDVFYVSVHTVKVEIVEFAGKSVRVKIYLNDKTREFSDGWLFKNSTLQVTLPIMYSVSPGNRSLEVKLEDKANQKKKNKTKGKIAAKGKDKNLK